ncbi:transposon Ty3-I Gag-Pol polyprotein [Trichonephila clavipes]|nr:transposon Ty3-I Gag-Pol polyprotein [Trichonephila clavipes]
MSQDRQKTYADKSRRPSPNYKVNDLVWVKLHPLSKASVYHTSALTPFLNGTETQSPVVPLKKRGRPRKQPLVPRGTAGENAILSASTPPHRDGLRRSEIYILSSRHPLQKIRFNKGGMLKMVIVMVIHLEDNIRRVIADIRPQMLEKVIENWTSRLDYIRASRGSPMPEIIFKM